MTTNRDFAAANAKSLARLAIEPKMSIEQADQIVRASINGVFAGSKSELAEALRLIKPMMAVSTPDTDWHAEALMYSEALGKVKDWCDMQHERWHVIREVRGIDRKPVDCPCLECETKRRILAIIAKGLK